MSEQLQVSESSSQKKRCCVCHSDFNDEPEVSCPGCDTKLHVDCFNELKECPTLGCNTSFQSRTGTVVGEAVAPIEQEQSQNNELVLAWRGLRRLFSKGSYLRWMAVWGVIAAASFGLWYYTHDSYRFQKYFFKKVIPLMLLGLFAIGPIVGAGLRFLMLQLVEYGKAEDDPKAQ